jgi:hypothetical protein
MKEFKATTTIKASSEKIWDILTDAAGYPNWDPNMIKLEGMIGPGEKLKIHTKISSRVFPVKVTNFVPGKKMTWSSGMPLGLFKGERTFSLTPQESGGVQFSLREVFSGPLLGLFGRSIPDLNPSFEQFAAGLKAQAEKAKK